MFTVGEGESRKTEEAFGVVPSSSTSKQKHLFLLLSLPNAPPGNLILLIHFIFTHMEVCRHTEGMRACFPLCLRR